MTVKFEYISTCCGHNYSEQRAIDEPMFFPKCNNCGNGNYKLINEIVISETVEREPGLISKIIEVTPDV